MIKSAKKMFRVAPFMKGPQSTEWSRWKVRLVNGPAGPPRGLREKEREREKGRERQRERERERECMVLEGLPRGFRHACVIDLHAPRQQHLWGSRVDDAGLRVWGFGYRLQGLGFMVEGFK